MLFRIKLAALSTIALLGLASYSAAAVNLGTPALACEGTLAEPKLDPWIRDLIKGYNQQPVLPSSFQAQSFWTRLKNEVFLRSFRIQLMFHAAPLSAVQNVDPINSSSSQMRRMLSQMDQSLLGWALRGSIFNAMMRLTDSQNTARTTSTFENTLFKMRAYHQEFKEDIDGYKKLYGEEPFIPEVLARGTINTQTMKLFALVDGGKTIPSRDAANAIALLHPITDEALDKGTVTKASISKLNKFLEDQIQPKIESSYEKILFGLLGYIYRDFPPAQHPWLYSMIRQLHYAQLRSMAQQDKISPEDLLYLTFEKGGLSTAIAGYLALGHLTPKQYEFFFKAGAIFQVMDDLLDIEIDLQEGGQTVWTTSIVNKQSLLPILDRFLAVQSHFENQLGALTADFSSNSQFANIYTFAYKLTIMRGLSRNVRHFAGIELDWIRTYFPISFATLRNFFKFTSTGNELLPEDIAEIIRASEAY